jgi:hypothetical protein
MPDELEERGGERMATIPKDQEGELRHQRKTREAIDEAFKLPQQFVANAEHNPIPPSERTSLLPSGSPEWYAAEMHRWKKRAEFLQESRDFLLFEYAAAMRIIDALLDQIDVRRASGEKGGGVRNKAVGERNEEWRVLAAAIRLRSPLLSDTGIAKQIRHRRSCKESVRTIRDVIGRKKVGRQP